MATTASASITLVDLNDVIVSTTAPLNPIEGALWFNEDDKKLYIYNEGQWVESYDDQGIKDQLDNIGKIKIETWARHYMKSPIFVKDPTDPIYAKSGKPNPPIGAVFNNINPNSRLIVNDIDTPSTAWALINMVKLHKITGKMEYYNHAVSIADYFLNYSIDADFYGAVFKAMPNAYTYDGTAWQPVTRFIHMRTFYHTIWAVLEAFEMTQDVRYKTLAQQLFDGAAIFHENIKQRVTNGELALYMWGGQYNTINSIDGATSYAPVWTDFATTSLDVIWEAVTKYIELFGDETRTNGEGIAYSIQSIRDENANHMKDMYDYYGLRKPDGNNMLYCFLRFGWGDATDVDGRYMPQPTNWDFINDVWGQDQWFTGDLQYWAITGMAKAGFTDIARSLMDRYYALRLQGRGDEILFYDRYDKDGLPLAEDQSVSIVFTALFMAVNEILGDKTHHTDATKTLRKYQIKSSDSLVDGGFNWDIIHPNQFLESKSLGEVVHSPVEEVSIPFTINDMDDSFGGLSDGLQLVQNELDDMTNDSLIDLKERQDIKDKLTSILGIILSDTTSTLPTTATLDAGLKGDFYRVRKSAVNAGLLTNNALYIDVATKYTALKTYLESLTPIDAWDTSLENRNQSIIVTKDGAGGFREKWMNYYLAVEKLETETANQLKKNADNIQVGGRNLIRNSTFNKANDEGVLYDWTSVNNIWKLVTPSADKPTSNILTANATGNTTNVTYSVTSNKFPARIGDIFTVSLDFKVTSATAWDVKTPLIFELFNSTGTRVQYTDVTSSLLGVTTVANDTWYRGKFTITVTNSTVVDGDIKLALFKNGELFVREVQVERGNRATDWTVAPEDNNEQIYLIEDRLATAEQVFENDGIVTTVMESTTFSDVIGKKADAEAIGDLATKEELGTALEGVGTTIDEKILDIDFTPYARSSDVKQTVDDLTISISKGGGINLIRNSIGYGGMNSWDIETTPLMAVRNDDLKASGITNAFYSAVNDSGKISQDINVFAGQAYTLSAFIRKVGDDVADAEATIAIYDDGVRITDIGLGNSLGPSNGFERFYVTYTPISNNITIEIHAGSKVDATFTGIMLNLGYVPFEWTTATGEMYNTNVKVDMNGLQVNQIENGVETGRTVMTPTKFAGYRDVDSNGVIDETKNSKDEVFRMDEDEFVMKKAVAREEITMGSIKLIKVEKGGNTGWAFVPIV